MGTFRTTHSGIAVCITRRRALGHFLNALGVMTLGACTQDPATQNTRQLKNAGPGALKVPPTKLAGLPDALNPKYFLIHNRKPLALESKRGSVPCEVVTPADRLFVRNNLPRPPESILGDRDAWTLTIKGVKDPGVLSVRQLKSLGTPRTVTMVLQCSGNGRAFFKHGASGSQWVTGAAGCVQWTGVRVVEVLKHMGGPTKYARYLTSTGGEPLPKDVPRNKVVVERSIPIEKGLTDCLLAWEMNGQPIPISHGGPLRLVVPGYFGCNQIKYIKTLAATRTQSSAKIQQTGYRFRPIGESGNPSQPSMWRMPVKSWFLAAKVGDARNERFPVTLEGVAFSGERAIRDIVFSKDNGRTWLSTQSPDSKALRDAFGINAWRRFSVSLTLLPGRYQFVSRATDSEGDTQPKKRFENERGYGHNGWLDHGLSVTVGASQTRLETDTQMHSQSESVGQITQDARDQGRTLFAEGAEPACGSCHTLKDAKSLGQVGPNLDQMQPKAHRVSKAVKNGVGAMPSYDGRLSDEEIKAISIYVETVTKP